MCTTEGALPPRLPDARQRRPSPRWWHHPSIRASLRKPTLVCLTVPCAAKLLVDASAAPRAALAITTPPVVVNRRHRPFRPSAPRPIATRARAPFNCDGSRAGPSRPARVAKMRSQAEPLAR